MKNDESKIETQTAQIAPPVKPEDTQVKATATGTARQTPLASIDPLTEQFGDPIYLHEDGKFCGINQSYMAGVVASENILIHSPEDDKFYTYDPLTGLYCETSPDALKQLISSRLLDISRELLQPGIERLRTDKTLCNIQTSLKPAKTGGNTRKFNSSKAGLLRRCCWWVS